MDWTRTSPRMSIIPRACGDNASTGEDQASGVGEIVSQEQDTGGKSPTGRRQRLSAQEHKDRIRPDGPAGNQVAKKESTKSNKGATWCVGPETFRTAGGAKSTGKVETMDQLLKREKKIRMDKFNLQMKQLNNVIETRKDMVTHMDQVGSDEKGKLHCKKVLKNPQDLDSIPSKTLEHVKKEQIGLKIDNQATDSYKTKKNTLHHCSNEASKNKIKANQLKESVAISMECNGIESPVPTNIEVKSSTKVQSLSNPASVHTQGCKGKLDNLSLTKACSQPSSQQEKQRVEQEKIHKKLTQFEPIRSPKTVSNAPTDSSSTVIYEVPIQESCCTTQKYSNTNVGEILTFTSKSLEPNKKNISMRDTARKQNPTSPVKSCKKDHYLSGLANLSQHQSTDEGDLAPEYETTQDFQVKLASKLTAQIVNTENKMERNAQTNLQAAYVNEDLLTDFSIEVLNGFDVLSNSKITAKVTEQSSELNKSSYSETMLVIKELKLDEKSLESSSSSDSGFESFIENESTNVDSNTIDDYTEKSTRFTVGSSSASYSESSGTSCCSYESFDDDSRSPSPEVEVSKIKSLDIWFKFGEKKKSPKKKSIDLNSPYIKTPLPIFSQVEKEVVTRFHDWINLMSDKKNSFVKNLQAKYEDVLPMCVVEPPEQLKIARVECQRDKNGKLHGEAEIYYENGDYFWGDFVHGSREGMASYIVKKTEDNFMGRYRNDQLDGFVVEDIAFCDRDCVVREVFYSHGVRHGFYREFDRTKQFWSIGRFENGEKTGVHWKWHPGNGFNVGELSQNNEPIGDSFYLYPDIYTVIRGNYEKGKLKKGEQVKITGYEEQYGIPYPKVAAMKSEIFYYSLSQSTVIAKRPQLRDPYESRYVFVEQSRIPFAGEGLFAKENIKAGQLCACFNGVRQRKLWGSKNENDIWSDYRITVNRDVDLDIYKEHESLDNYRATIAHKACHSFVNNAGFQRLDHPQYGQIMSVVANIDIAAGEEILVNYNYSIPKAPLWYQEVWFAHCRNHLNWTEEELVKWAEKITNQSGVPMSPLPPPKDSPRFVSCGECSEHVGLQSCSVMCELCEEWHHVECVKGLDLKMLEEEHRDSFEWFCQSCAWKSRTK